MLTECMWIKDVALRFGVISSTGLRLHMNFRSAQWTTSKNGVM